MDFTEEVFKATKKIPKGKVSTYKLIAKSIKRPKACRAVGNSLNKNTCKDIPCHRVIKSDGCLGGFRRGFSIKKKVLEKEGVEVTRGRVDLEKYLFS
jgi:O-6-methylguanine DNA methyltransferase